MGLIFDDKLRSINSPLIAEIRGRGLFYSIELYPKNSYNKVDGHDLTRALIARGMVTKPTRDTTLRLAPALTITERQLL